ncbi:MAG: signal peptidase I [Candidatus Zixiibacteriota bacterium]|nr:MAG: signal peptidase I [candidate division Zixibacteria bacterium]HDL04370.1 signal peptidase I [candidate division Zixibacteria bacterium]
MPKSAFDIIWENVKSFLIAIVLAVIIKTSIVEAYKIPSASMEDTLLVGDFLIANKFKYGARLPVVNWQLPAFRDPQPGDVVIFKWPGDGVTNYIKRCVAVGGQTVEIKDKILYVDGKVFPNPEMSKFTRPVVSRPPGGEDTRDNYGPKVVPRDCYFMMGDNRDNSYDSRFWGPVHKDLILGEAMFIHWSWRPDEKSPEISISDPLSVPRLFLYNVAHFPQRVRWNRLFNIIN